MTEKILRVCLNEEHLELLKKAHERLEAVRGSTDENTVLSYIFFLGMAYMEDREQYGKN